MLANAATAITPIPINATPKMTAPRPHTEYVYIKQYIHEIKPKMNDTTNRSLPARPRVAVNTARGAITSIVKPKVIVNDKNKNGKNSLPNSIAITRNLLTARKPKLATINPKQIITRMSAIPPTATKISLVFMPFP